MLQEPLLTSHRTADNRRCASKTKGVVMAVGGMKRPPAVVTAAAMVAVVVTGCGSGGSDDSSSGGKVTLELAQWWGAELPKGSFDKMIGKFESQNPNIKVKVLSAPYASTKQQLVSGAASQT